MSAELKALVMMQLKDKIDLSFLKTKKGIISKVVLSLLALVAITAVIFLLFYVAKLMNVFSLISNIPVTVIVVIFTVMYVLSIISCTYSLMKTLFFAKDNQVLLTLPVSTTQVFASKLIVSYLYEFVKSLYFIFPLFVAYGMICSFPFMFYFWALFCMIILSALPVALGALFSIFAMLINIFLKNYPVIKWILFSVCIALGVWLVITVISAIPPNIDLVRQWGIMYWDIQAFLNDFYIYAYPFTMITKFVVGGYVGLSVVIINITTLYVGLCLLGLIVLCIGLAFLIAKPIFTKMASTPFEYKRKETDKAKLNKVLGNKFSLVKKEALMAFRNSEEIISMVAVAVAMPILIYLLNTIFQAMSTRLLGDYMIVSFNLLMILLISLASNNKIASVYSREGSASYLIKTRPIEYYMSLLAKLIVPSIIMVISIIASVAIFKGFNALSIGNTICLGVGIIFVYLNHLLWSAEMDFMNPQYAQYATTGNHISNPNETKSSIAMFVLAFLFFGATLLLSIEDANSVWIKMCIVALGLLVYRCWSFFAKIKYFYKDK